MRRRLDAPEIADAAGVAAEDLIDALVNAQQTLIDEALADATIDEDHATELSATLKEHITNLVNGAGHQDRTHDEAGHAGWTPDEAGRAGWTHDGAGQAGWTHDGAGHQDRTHNEAAHSSGNNQGSTDQP